MTDDRNTEDIEEKSPEEVAEIYKKNGKYYCAECHSELPFKDPCPVCKKQVDWNRIDVENRGP